VSANRTCGVDAAPALHARYKYVRALRRRVHVSGSRITRIVSNQAAIRPRGEGRTSGRRDNLFPAQTLRNWSPLAHGRQQPGNASKANQNLEDGGNA
jgi:hypothetical protein